MEATIAPEAAPSQAIDVGGDDSAFFQEIRRHQQDFKEGKNPLVEHPREQGQRPQKKEAGAKKPVEKNPVEQKKTKIEPVQPVEDVEDGEESAENAEDDDIPTYKDRIPTEKEKATWKNLKSIKAEYEKFKPEFDKLQKEFEELKKKPALSEELEKEMAELRTFRDMTNFKLSDKYKTDIAEPMQAADSEIFEILAEFKVDKGEFAKAMAETTAWKRNVAIDKILAEAEDEVPAGASQRLRELSGEFHNIWKKEAAMEQDAIKGSSIRDAEQREQMTKKSLEEKQAWQKAKSSAMDLVKESAAPLLKGMSEKERNEFLSAMESTDISDDPQEKALQAVSVQYAAVLINQLNKLNQELAAAKKESKALSQARPNSRVVTGDKVEKSSLDEDDDALFNEIKDHRANGRR